jgi:hypothetical protein
MKIKRLKKIIIGSTVFKIEWKKSLEVGNFDYDKEIIKIGCKYSEQETFNSLIHILKEILNIQQNTRFAKTYKTDDYIFVYDHYQHTDLCNLLSDLIYQFLE